MANTSVRYAVTDGPGGHQSLAMPDDHVAAAELRARYKELWCSTAANGCGQLLSASVGKKNRPHFRHQSHEAHKCALVDGTEEFQERSYLHLALQLTLEGWLTGQGLEPRLEYQFDDRSRADIRVEVDELEHTIEVQLSPLPADEWARRDERYRSHITGQVSWLFGSNISPDVRHPTIVSNGVAFGIALQSPSQAPADSSADSPAGPIAPADLLDPAHVFVVTYGPRGFSANSSLSDCRLIRDGLWTPHRDRLIEEHRERARAEDPRAVQRRHSSDGGGSGGRERSPVELPPENPGATDAKRAAIPPIPPPPAPDDRLVDKPAPALTADELSAHPRRPRGQNRQPLATGHLLHAGEHQAPPELYTHLPESLHDAAQTMAYIVTTIELNGPETALSFPDVDDGTAIQDALLAVGLIELYAARDVVRWRRPLGSA
ncbi:competence protein CoiA family protein [Nocardioides sp. ChNu-99]|uniref:competence protein CoiA family protein n=1 Tax=Nocardioides sp. ChNu-99 TaxID=2839897 RepID=UPI002404BF64|nr:competence protein CoiA family protein [Nocardioides sp. ChNu-99]MDF9716453.1 hypothetical protein [Nocardioides sp. ChNu-99]